MRLVIDLQSCQNGAAQSPAAVLALAQALVRGAAARPVPHTVLIAYAASQQQQIDALRQAFDGLLPPQQLLSYATPALGGWPQQAAVLVRDGFLASLNPDAVFAPGLFDIPLSDTVYGPGPEHALMIYSSAEAGDERQQECLRHAALVVELPADVENQADADTDALAARLWQQFENAHAAALAHRDGAAAGRPRLAYISPLPPQKSGIADYSAEVIAELEAYYDIELVVADDSLAAIAATPLGQRLPLLTPAQFEQQAQRFTRLLYHFGNSNAHQYMFPLLERHPGVVVLHDFFLSGVLDNMERDGVQEQAFLQALYASHGHTGLLSHKEHGRNPSIWTFPCNKTVLDQAEGVIVHAEFSRTLAEQWYGPGSADQWQVLPLLRGQADLDAPAQARAAARAALGLKDQDFLVCSFGMLGPTKLNHRLLDAWLASPLAQQPNCQLVFVGENEGGQYGAELLAKIAASPAAARIRITGFASADDYRNYLAASDAAVQLRTQTRGETSASVLDCLLHGVPTIINAHGAAASIPKDVLVQLPDLFEDAQLSAALAQLHADPARRAALATAGREHVRVHHAPAAVGRQYYDAIEDYARSSAQAHYRRTLAALGALPGHPDQVQLASVATALAANQPSTTPRQLLIDISALVQHDPKTGIQRVVRSILLVLLNDPPAGYRVEPVYSDGGNRSYRYARRFTQQMLGVGAPWTAPVTEDAPIEVRAGDTFLGLDLATNMTTQNQPQLLALRRRGVAVWFVVYDLLPMLRPECFPFGAEKYYGDFLDTIALASDGIVTISRAVSDELATWLSQRPNRRVAPLKLSHFHLGADIDASAPSSGLPANAERVMAALKETPTLLMVGTLEPRKGQAQALAACELLWAKGVAVNLVIVGKNGWMVDNLAQKLDNHPQREQRLFWLSGLSDEMLLKLYENCAALLAASEGEGFGLPLIEAAQHRLPIIARGIPVFREVAGEHAYYFDGSAPADLANAIEAWLDLHAQGRAPQSAGMPWLTWQQAAQQLMDATIHGGSHGSLAADSLTPQLLVDVSAIARHDLKTGIQRVVRAQLLELLRAEGKDFQVLPVYLSDEGGWHYRHARRYQHELAGTDSGGVHDDEVVIGAGDVFYSPDFFPRAVIEASRAGLYARWRAAGVQINFLIHDILPVLRPEFFPPNTDAEFGEWLHAISADADRLVCISGAVADETRAWLTQHAPQRPLPQFAVLHHGADLSASAGAAAPAAAANTAAALPDDAAAVLADLDAHPSFLMVGTIEPRKGHLQALDAFDQLWSEGVDARLVIVGGEGWRGLPDDQRRTIPTIMARLRGHPELGRRLLWLHGVSDAYLEQLYQHSACLLVPSEGEGFGLPLIEAAHHRRPLLVRDIPVFREVAQQHAHYYQGGGAELAAAVRLWLTLHADGKAPASTGIAGRTWADNARQLSTLLFSPSINTESTESPSA
jgi:glycosyltransferase involved in cell wall biosynthesis